ncbi:MAG TPA: hypothetical protein VFY06_14200, partial [Verrucomicrobiae bacterium]|nr:hypothetical protein [Verrucomicrobiae bacterium]
MSKTTSAFMRLAVPLTLLFLTGLARAASVTFEAESGVLGADWAVSSGVSPTNITITTDSTGTNPGSDARV